MTEHATNDYGLIAFLRLIKKVSPDHSKTKKIRRGRMEYVFVMPDEDWFSVRMEYSNSIFPKFLQEIKLAQDPSF